MFHGTEKGLDHILRAVSVERKHVIRVCFFVIHARGKVALDFTLIHKSPFLVDLDLRQHSSRHLQVDHSCNASMGSILRYLVSVKLAMSCKLPDMWTNLIWFRFTLSRIPSVVWSILSRQILRVSIDIGHCIWLLQPVGNSSNIAGVCFSAIPLNHGTSRSNSFIMAKAWASITRARGCRL